MRGVEAGYAHEQEQPPFVDYAFTSIASPLIVIMLDVTEGAKEKIRQARDREMNSLGKHVMFDLVPADSIPPGAKIISSRFVDKVKANAEYKSRLVVQANYQQLGYHTFHNTCIIRLVSCVEA